ncbi:hypothetical protein P692DRAFT_201813083 [Suillus brevipes Sb2]|nr:hypothetical protein P692DRAFT_201813083 [Suillus brevipes Sb2]
MPGLGASTHIPTDKAPGSAQAGRAGEASRAVRGRTELIIQALTALINPMETPSSPSSTITAPPDCHETARMLAKLTTEAVICQSALLHYDSVSKSMIEWCW